MTAVFRNQSSSHLRLETYMTPLRMIAIAALAVAVACNDPSTATPVTTQQLAHVAAFDVQPQSHPIWAEQIVGETGPGSSYALYVPHDWNGDLVVYAHGYVMPQLPVTLPEISALRDAFGANRYAVAYSSYSENGFDLKDGAQRTHQLSGLFAAKVGRPEHTYIIGHSLGGAITMYLAEKYPNHYDGALPMCGFVGGSTAEVNYIANVRILFNVFYPGVLAGTAAEVPASLQWNAATQAAIVAAISANPTGAVVISQTHQTAVPIGSAAELGSSIIQALAFQIFGTNDLRARTHGHVPFDNANTVYSSSNPGLADALAAANAGAERYTTSPDAANYLQQYFEPSGNLRIPTLTLHTTRDPVVPAWHEPLYAAKAAAAGSTANLVQRSVNRFGHCTFTGAETLQAFGDLVGWVEFGVRPNP
jgi:pimeloyl-ACP methyl ester carboxylesterase